MEASVFTNILLPLLLALIMLGMGLSLQISDFSRLAKTPKPIFIGLFGQLILLPVIAFSFAVLFNASESVAIGLMILAACPGGTSSNLFTHIAKANLALSISLTAVTTIVCVFSTPFLIAFSIDYFSLGERAQFSLLKTSLGLIILTLVPVLLGMWFKAKQGLWAQKLEPIFRRASLIFMVLLIGKIIYDENERLMDAFPDMFTLTVGLNLLATAMGVFLAKLFLLDKNDQVTLGIEIGTQNATLAMLIALSFIEVPAYAIVAGVYGVAMYLGAFICVMFAKQKQTRPIV